MWFSVILISVIVAALLILKEQPVSLSPYEVLSTADYNVVTVKVPALAGLLLSLFLLVAKSLIWPLLVRHLLNQNGIVLILRDLASKLPQNLPLAHYPMTGLTGGNMIFTYKLRLVQQGSKSC
jgi:hydrogenase-4 membrane subunit HyfE